MIKILFLQKIQKGGFGLLFALALCVTSCKKESSEKHETSTEPSTIDKWLGNNEIDCDDIDVSASTVQVKITRVEKELMDIRTPQDAHAFLTKYPDLAKQFFAIDHYPKKEILETNLSKLAQDTAINVIYKQTQETYDNIEDLESQFAAAFSHIKHYYPTFKAPKVYSIITGLGVETYVSDSLIVLSLDYFLGNKAKYKPRDPSGLLFPDYILKRYKREYIVPACMLYISNKYNKVDMLENTLLADMIYFGKAYQFVRTMMPCIPDSLIVGYTGQQLKDTEEHEGLIWSFFVDKKLLYETSHFIKNKYTGERPYTAEIGPKCPGKIGTWLGWQIVQDYQKAKPETTFPALMESKSAKTLFLDSKYKPKKK